MASAAGDHSKEDAKRFAQEVGEAWKRSTDKDHEGYIPDYFIKGDDILYGYQRYGIQPGTKNVLSNKMHYHFFFDRDTEIPTIQLTCASDSASKGIDRYRDRRAFVRTAMTPDEWVEYFRQGLKSCWESTSSGVATASSQRASSPSRRSSSPSRRSSSPSRRASSPSRRSSSPRRTAVTHSTTAKARPCKFHAENKCTKGDKCPFAHTTPHSSSGTAKARPCKFHAENKCTKGDKCPFAHTTPRGGGGGYRRRKSKKTQKLRYRKNKGLTIKRTVNRTYHKS